MREMSSWRGAVVAAGLLASSSAWALPWNVDMVDSKAVKAYESVMRPLPEGVMSQPNLLTPISYRRNFVRESPEGQALTNPFDASDAAFLATGERMYNVYCQPCHGDGVVLGPVAAPGRYPAVGILGGPAGRLAGKTDGHVYLTIRNGGGIMPGYGWAMDDREMWAVVAWMRASIPNAAAAPATPSAEATAQPSTEGTK
jgi:mono/diheme cytochrome c family protein